MSESKDLLLANEYLRRSKRRWKALALAACAALLFVTLFGFLAMTKGRMRFVRQRRQVIQALAREHQARVVAQRAASPGQPK
jgi:hypothetical protein